MDAFLLSPDFALPPLDIMTTLRDNSTLYSLTTTLEVGSLRGAVQPRCLPTEALLCCRALHSTRIAR